MQEYGSAGVQERNAECRSQNTEVGKSTLLTDSGTASNPERNGEFTTEVRSVRGRMQEFRRGMQNTEVRIQKLGIYAAN
jgi:hypothetical protein